MNVIITGSSNGIGKATALKFLNEGHTVYGLDIESHTIEHNNYYHYMTDVSDYMDLPQLDEINILVNNAGVQCMHSELQDYGQDLNLKVNLEGVINCTEKYGFQPSIISICNLASVSAHNGAEFGTYCASKGGVLSYTKWTAKQIAETGGTCNSISFGGVLTDLNKPVIEDEALWKEIMGMTPLKKWCTPEEAAEWIYFITVVNTSMTGQDIIVDNGEMHNHKFIWV